MGKSITDYFSRMMAIVNKFQIHGGTMKDLSIVEKILCSLTTKFNYVVCSIEEANDLEDLSIYELQNSLQMHEKKINLQDVEEQAPRVAVNSRSYSRGKGKSKGKGKNSSSEESQSNNGNSKAKSRNKANIECYCCHKFGHYRSKFRVNLSKDRGQKSNFSERDEQDKAITLLMGCHSKEKTRANLWYLDTSCSNHMCGKKSVYHKLDESFRDTVRFGDNSAVSIMGKGKVSIQTKVDSIQSISNVLFVPDLKTNLLSAGQLQEKGHEITTKDGMCHV